MGFKITVAIIIIFSTFIAFIYIFDKRIMPTVIVVANSEMRVKVNEIMNENILEKYSEGFDYNSIVNVEKDHDGNIVMLKADTLKLNSLATKVALDSQKDINDLEYLNIKVPIGYILNNNILSNRGPNVTVRMKPIGKVEVKYSSVFESAGINQTRHKIYVEIKSLIRVIIPLHSNDVEVRCEVPISETIIIGKVPRTAIDLDLSN
ncbi:sporulation protein YunB [Clostridium sp. MSJ-4]|uniref:Sporulation protein YunB n=2 Tax=Clostridiaceae TaxID=31979 RepID=A0ABS6F079_9CLOT|nr:sporulation protein YunB [Clostridium simiarum]